MTGTPESNPDPHVRPPLPATPCPSDPLPEVPDETGASPTEGVAEIVKEIREGLAEISARELELRRHEQYFGRRYRELEQAALRTFTQEHDEAQQRLVQQAAELNAQAVEIAAQRARLKKVTDDMHAREVELEQQRGDIARRTQQTRERAESLRLWLQEQHQLLDERREALRRQEEELQARAPRVQGDLTRERTALDRRRTELESRATQLDEAERDLLARRAELEREASDRAAQQRAEDDLALDLPVVAVAQPSAPLVLQPRGAWWPRTAAAAVLVAVLTAAAWYLAHPATYSATTVIRIASESPISNVVANRHRMQLLDPALLADDPLAGAWRTACEEARVAVTVADGDAALRLSVTAHAATAARDLSAAACAVYTRRIQVGAGNTELPLGYQDLVRRREKLEGKLQQLRQDAVDGPTAPDGAAPDDRAAEIAAAGQVETDLAEVRMALDEQRAGLAVLLATEVPHGSVDPAAVEQALNEDTIYREDRGEFHTVALQYRTELAVGMLLLVDPIKTANKALAALAGSLEEQRGLQPPAEIGALLEECTAAVSEAQAKLTPLAGQWQAWLDSVQNMDVSADVVELVAQQNLASETARRLAEVGAALVEHVGAQIEGLGSRGGGTRDVVVAAVLRGDHASLKTAMEAFSAAAGKTATAENFELDALDRKLRGLRMRLTSRRNTIAQDLQLEADRAAREQHAALLQETRVQVRDLERRREELVTNLAAALRKLRTLDEALRRHQDWELRAEARDAEIAWLAARSAEIAQELAEAQQQGTEPEQVEFAAPVIQCLPPGRARAATLAGGAAFVSAWLLGALLSLQNPWRRAAAPYWI